MKKKPLATAAEVDRLINAVVKFHGFARIEGPYGSHLIVGGLRGPGAMLVLSMIKLFRSAALTGSMPEIDVEAIENGTAVAKKARSR